MHIRNTKRFTILSCTCQMGADSDSASVVDPQLRAKGIEKPGVVDMPVCPMTAITKAPTIMVGAEKETDLILKKRRALI